MKISMNLNGKEVTADVADNLLLVEFLREHQRLTGVHVGCDTSQCGACVVHINGKSVKTCSMLAVQANGTTITTIEGLADGDQLHAVQAAFKECHGLQCGFCTPGMVMSVTDLLQQNPSPSEEEIRHWLEGNICRCTGYQNIVRAVQHAAAALRG
ncbi:MAG: (2Fe-2S)-binding protein [Gammaproteobacteria bacterium WSBS_2016_MAG_OTU1]